MMSAMNLVISLSTHRSSEDTGEDKLRKKNEKMKNIEYFDEK
jgi:hypothetical protein